VVAARARIGIVSVVGDLDQISVREAAGTEHASAPRLELPVGFYEIGRGAMHMPATALAAGDAHEWTCATGFDTCRRTK
jgi:hypothetical protein